MASWLSQWLKYTKEAHQYGRTYALACRRQAVKGFQALSVAQALAVLQLAEQSADRILKQKSHRTNADAQRKAVRVELCAPRRARSKKTAGERVVPATSLPNGASPRTARVQQRALDLERKVAQQEEELNELRRPTSRAGVANAMVAMLLAEAKGNTFPADEWASKRRRLLLCLGPGKLVARSCAVDFVKALEGHALWT